MSIFDKLMTEQTKRENKQDKENIKKELSKSFKDIEKINNPREYRQKENELIDNNPNLTDDEKKYLKRRKDIKDWIPLIVAYTLIATIGCIVGSIFLFINSHVFLGILLLLVPPLIITLTIKGLLKYTNIKFNDHFEYIRKKVHKVVSSDWFFVVCIIIGLLVFTILMIIIATKLNASTN